MHVQQHGATVGGELVVLHAAHAHLPIEQRAADVQRAETIGAQYQVQARGVHVQWRRLGPDAELAGHAAFPAEAHGDEIALYQRLEAGDPGQRDRRLDHPELAAAEQQLLGARVHGQLGDRPGKVAAHVDLAQRADLYAIEDHRRASGLQAADVVQLQLDPETGLGCLEVLVQAEGEGRIGRRAVLTMFRGGEGDATGGQADQRLGAQLEAGQAAAEADAAGVPETGVLAHQVGIGRLDEDLDLDGALVLAEAVALDLTDLDLPVEHRTALVQRAEAIGLEGDVQTGQRIG